jgi:hypothetical protein
MNSGFLSKLLNCNQARRAPGFINANFFGIDAANLMRAPLMVFCSPPVADSIGTQELTNQFV